MAFPPSHTHTHTHTRKHPESHEHGGLRRSSNHGGGDNNGDSLVWTGASRHITTANIGTRNGGTAHTMGAKQPCKSKAVTFTLLVPGRKVAPSMVVPYRQICWLAMLARTRDTPQTMAPATWEVTTEPKGGADGQSTIHRGLTPTHIATCDRAAQGRAARGPCWGDLDGRQSEHRGLRPTNHCPCCNKKSTRGQGAPALVVRSPGRRLIAFYDKRHAPGQALKLGSLREWSACLRLCRIILEGIV